MGASKTPQGLTHKQETFCQNIINGMSQHDAYKNAYNVRKMSNKAIDEEGCKLAKTPKIYQRIQELKQLSEFIATQKVSEKLIWTREMSLKALVSIFKDQNTNSSAKVSAIKEINAMYGYNAPTKIELGLKPEFNIIRDTDG